MTDAFKVHLLFMQSAGFRLCPKPVTVPANLFHIGGMDEIVLLLSYKALDINACLWDANIFSNGARTGCQMPLYTITKHRSLLANFKIFCTI